MTRYALIDNMLANRYRAYSILDITEELAEKLADMGYSPVSKRCVEKDINYLMNESPFSAEIEEYWIEASDRNDRPYRKRCLRYADPTFSIFKPKLTPDEKNVLSATLETLGSFEGLENFEWLNDIQERLDIEQQRPIISFSKNLLSDSTLFARLFTAIKNNQVVLINFHTFQNREERTVSLTPYLLKEYNNRWFVVGGASDTGKILTFALDRIDDFKVDYYNAHTPPPADWRERYEEIIGITYSEDNPVEKIVFWISNNSKAYIDTKPLHTSQTPIRGEKEKQARRDYPTLSDGGFYRIECRENYELIRELMAFGPELIVISPIELRNKIKRRIEEMDEHYRQI